VNLAACGGLSLNPENRVWYRAVNLAYGDGLEQRTHDDLANAVQSRRAAASASAFPDSVSAEDPVTATFEFGAMLGNPFVPGGAVPHPGRAFAMLNVQVTLSQVADLTGPAAQTQLQTTAQELTGDWDGYQVRGAATPISSPVGQAPTQELRHALFQVNVEGFRSISAKVPCNDTLMVFPQRLRPGSSLVFRDQSGTLPIASPEPSRLIFHLDLFLVQSQNELAPAVPAGFPLGVEKRHPRLRCHADGDRMEIKSLRHEITFYSSCGKARPLSLRSPLVA
jgi:hypothetical protein